MTWTKLDDSLPGHPTTATIEITYWFPDGVQGPEHPNPGKAYCAPGFPRVTYLPDSIMGQKVLRCLRKAFRRRLLFTVGRSLTFELADCVTWAGVPHKTVVHGTCHGYPDPNYLDRVMDELKERGVTDQEHEDKLRQDKFSLFEKLFPDMPKEKLRKKAHVAAFADWDTSQKIMAELKQEQMNNNQGP